MKKAFIGIVLLALIGASVGYYMYNKAPDKMESLSVNETVSAENLYASYESNEEEANKKFLDKVLLIKGKVVEVITNDESISVMLETGDIGSIMCQLEDTKSVLPTVGSTVSIKGLCTGYLMDVVIIKAIVV